MWLWNRFVIETQLVHWHHLVRYHCAAKNQPQFLHSSIYSLILTTQRIMKLTANYLIRKKYKDYIEKDAKVTGLKWEPIHDLSKVRNCIVHASGKVTGSKHEARLRQLAKKKDGLFVSGYNHDFQSQVQPLYFEDDILVLESEYCKRVVKTVQIFFKELCDKIPLPRLSVSFLDD